MGHTKTMKTLIALISLLLASFFAQGATNYADILISTNIYIPAREGPVGNYDKLSAGYLEINRNFGDYGPYIWLKAKNQNTDAISYGAVIFLSISNNFAGIGPYFASDIGVQGNLVCAGTVSAANTIMWVTNNIYVTNAQYSAMATNAQTANFAKNCTGLGYTNIYRALLTQTWTAAPTAIVLENTFGSPLVWTYVASGYYKVALANAFTTNKTYCTIGNGQWWFNSVQMIDSSSIYVQCRAAFSNAGQFDGGLGFTTAIGGQPPNPTPFEILVYP